MLGVQQGERIGPNERQMVDALRLSSLLFLLKRMQGKDVGKLGSYLVPPFLKGGLGGIFRLGQSLTVC